MPNLVGIGLSQVPTNSMLGGMAYQDPEHASIKNLDLKNLSQINSEIADTAIGVFVYDTSKDSDGGAWRKRTQDTSWYNENLGTETRGNRREFPAVAVIVAEQAKVTIYDGDDPNLPMWMVFKRSTGNNSTMLGYSGTYVTSIHMLNGILCVGHWSGGWGISVIRFISDSQSWLWAGSAYSYPRTGQRAQAIIQRNDELHWIGVTGINSGIISGYIKDVAMTVIPNALIDSDTGLPVPTIVAATSAGLSVIRDNNSIISTQSSSYVISKVNFTDDHGINAVAQNGSSGNWGGLYINDIESINGLSYATYENWDGVVYQYKYGTKVLPYNALSVNDTVSDFIDLKNRSSAIGIQHENRGLTLLKKSPKDAFDPDAGMVAFVASNYNTGYMHGDIKRAFLSDTDTTNVVGTELISNGTFDSNTNGWSTNSNGTLVSSGGRGVLTNTQSGDRVRSNISFTTVIGKRYLLSFNTNDNGADGGFLHLGTTAGNVQYEANIGAGGNGDYTKEFTATATTGWIQIGLLSTANGATASYDNISVKLIEEDRSPNNEGLQVFGTITKTPVATGAELVAYSGFSNSNYLERNTNAINFGTSGKISFTGWVKQSSTSEYSYIASVTGSSTGNPVGMALMTSTGNFYVYEGTVVKQSSTSISDGNWHHCVGIVDGTTVRGYVDGHEVLNTTGTAPNLSSIDEFAVGHFATSGRAYPNLGSLALVRISASIPSPEQIKKMYDEEKCLFHENAKATLYGSSDAVTALAFDDTTNLLHVGTSAGRSEFQGLRRINNTTTAVTTAISASNGLVAEQ